MSFNLTLSQPYSSLPSCQLSATRFAHTRIRREWVPFTLRVKNHRDDSTLLYAKKEKHSFRRAAFSQVCRGVGNIYRASLPLHDSPAALFPPA